MKNLAVTFQLHGYEIYQSGDFDRLGDADPNEFWWLVSMKALHGGAPLTQPPNDLYGIETIYIGNGLFYTHNLYQIGLHR